MEIAELEKLIEESTMRIRQLKDVKEKEDVEVVLKELRFCENERKVLEKELALLSPAEINNAVIIHRRAREMYKEACNDKWEVLRLRHMSDVYHHRNALLKLAEGSRDHLLYSLEPKPRSASCSTHRW